MKKFILVISIVITTPHCAASNSTNLPPAPQKPNVPQNLPSAPVKDTLILLANSTGADIFLGTIGCVPVLLTKAAFGRFSQSALHHTRSSIAAYSLLGAAAGAVIVEDIRQHIKKFEDEETRVKAAAKELGKFAVGTFTLWSFSRLLDTNPSLLTSALCVAVGRGILSTSQRAGALEELEKAAIAQKESLDR